MSVVSLSDGFLNADGLYVAYGVNEGKVTRGGEFADLESGRHVATVEIDLTKLPTVASANVQIVADNVVIPNDAMIERVEVVTTKETAGANANFNLGLVRMDRSTEIDFNGLLAAADAFNGGTDVGTVFAYGATGSSGVESAEGGALLGTRITHPGLIVGWADTADFTAGKILCRIYYDILVSADE